MKYDLIVSDYDGTLGGAPNNDIPKPTLAAINKFIERGGIFAVCSGREYGSIRTICVNQGLKGLVASFQGARINDIETQECLFDGGMSKEQALLALKAVKGKGLDPVVYAPNGFYLEKNTAYSDIYEKAVGVKGWIADSEKVVCELGKVCKLGWLGEPSIVSRLAKELNEQYSDKGVQFNIGVSFLLEAINPSCGKGEAVKFLADYYGIPLEKVMAVGDNTNDISLITGEWHGVAVGDGKPELKAVAKEVTVPFSEHPIKHLIEKYNLID